MREGNKGSVLSEEGSGVPSSAPQNEGLHQVRGQGCVWIRGKGQNEQAGEWQGLDGEMHDPAKGVFSLRHP